MKGLGQRLQDDDAVHVRIRLDLAQIVVEIGRIGVGRISARLNRDLVATEGAFDRPQVGLGGRVVADRERGHLDIAMVPPDPVKERAQIGAQCPRRGAPGQLHRIGQMVFSD